MKEIKKKILALLLPIGERGKHRKKKEQIRVHSARWKVRDFILFFIFIRIFFLFIKKKDQ